MHMGGIVLVLRLDVLIPEFGQAMVQADAIWHAMFRLSEGFCTRGKPEHF